MDESRVIYRLCEPRTQGRLLLGGLLGESLLKLGMSVSELRKGSLGIPGSGCLNTGVTPRCCSPN